MFDPVDSPFLVPYDGSFRRAEWPTSLGEARPAKAECKRRLREQVERLRDLQEVLYADDRYSILLVFQAMDAAGKDSTIRAVTSGINPAGFQVFSFKQPSKEELDHGFLWRTARRLPERGRIGVFNRSYYEEVLVVRVHPEYLGSQRLPHVPDLDTLWQQRFESIREHEQHLARNGMVILKFFLNVSQDEQKRRFLRRIDRPEKNWKFAPGDVRERAFFPSYMEAYEDALNATSRPWAPWYSIPADNKPFMRLTVAEILAETLASLDLRFPVLSPEDRAEMLELRQVLESEPSSD